MTPLTYDEKQEYIQQISSYGNIYVIDNDEQFF